jgi:hypothetical protein
VFIGLTAFSFLCYILYVSSFLSKLSSYSKSIIFISIVALLVAGFATHRFDPFHPKLMTSECMDATLLCREKIGWVMLIAGIAISCAGYDFWRRRLDSSYTSAVTLVEFSVLNSLFDPVFEAFRRGKLRRLTYH